MFLERVGLSTHGVVEVSVDEDFEGISLVSAKDAVDGINAVHVELTSSQAKDLIEALERAVEVNDTESYSVELTFFGSDEKDELVVEALSEEDAAHQSELYAEYNGRVISRRVIKRKV